MNLTSKNVETIFMSCLFEDTEEANDDNTVIARGIVIDVEFNSEQLNKQEDNIYSMLKELPQEFFRDGGGGWSFLKACNDKHGVQWTSLHQTMEQLFLLGMAIGKVKSRLPKEMWSALPGGMPYYVIE